ncbi:MAG: YkgJ family cysteine cluster protein [Deltaproteobacteria bacterium]|nr:YkgJ family cysteine cluster protein [Deltaproteobacteria bacterium]MBW2635664.1 YkgJ family cysteine cluster protein [Deltaproteobacteria bacterium]MBW2676195.1 YkgJ family cysteine cluster protein [Deltaproteobacteria bacterium]
MPCDSAAVCVYRGENIFSCKQCGDCCKGYGGTYVSRAEIESIATYIGMDPERFEKKYCTMSGGRMVLSQQESGFCVFWCDRMCDIHPVKPRMCREWPFIRSLLVDPDNWQKMASMCPGIRKEVPAEVVQECVKSMLERKA